MMIPIEPLSSALSDEKAAEWRQIRTRTRTNLEEARETPGCEALVAVLERDIAAIDEGLAKYDAAVGPLLEAHERLETVRVAARVAKELYSHGADDRKKALQLRDDLEVAEARVRFVLASFEVARKAVPRLAGAPVDASIGEAKALVDKLVKACLNRAFPSLNGSTEVAREVWQKWVERHEDWLVWAPLLIARACKEAEPVWEAYKPSDVWKGPQVPNPETLRDIWNQLVEDRKTFRAAAQ